MTETKKPRPAFRIVVEIPHSEIVRLAKATESTQDTVRTYLLDQTPQAKAIIGTAELKLREVYETLLKNKLAALQTATRGQS